MTQHEHQQAMLLGQQILNLTVGEKSEVALIAVTDALATLIGWGHHGAGASIDVALETADAISQRVDAHIIQHWGQIVRVARDA